MASYLLTWNPKNWTWTDLPQVIRGVARGKSPLVRWSCGNRRELPKGSRVFLVRLGEEPRGIVGWGVTTLDSYRDTHWSDPSKETNYVGFRFDGLRETPVVPWTELLAPPFEDFVWSPQAGGVEVPEEIADALVARCEQRFMGDGASGGIPDGIRRADLIAAIGRLDAGAKHGFGDSTRYDVVYKGRTYPPKAVVGLAAERFAGRVLGPADFSGGVDSKCFRILEREGFEVVPKGSISLDELIGDLAEDELRSSRDIGETEKETLIRARRGQGTYRRDLERIEKACRVTGVTELKLLRASHIKPWSKSSNQERWIRVTGCYSRHMSMRCSMADTSRLRTMGICSCRDISIGRFSSSGGYRQS